MEKEFDVDTDLAGNTALVPAGTKGIGKAIAKRLQQVGTTIGLLPGIINANPMSSFILGLF